MKGRTLPAKPAGENLRVFDFQKRQLKTKRNVEKTEKQKPCILLQSLRASSLPEGACGCAFFFPVPQRKQAQDLSFQNRKATLLKRKTFAVVFLFALQSVTGRLPSFKEGSCRRRRLRGVAVRQKAGFVPPQPVLLRIVPRVLLRQRSRSLCAFLREEGVTRKRDERSPRN